MIIAAQNLRIVLNPDTWYYGKGEYVFAKRRNCAPEGV